MRHLGQKLRENYDVQQIEPALLQAINKLSAAKVSSFLKKPPKPQPFSAVKMKQELTENGVTPQYFQHYKGGIYELVAEATQESDLTPVIVYKAQNGSWWTRPKTVFFEEIELDGVMVPRFKPI
jgi:hypothetical protein